MILLGPLMPQPVVLESLGRLTVVGEGVVTVVVKGVVVETVVDAETVLGLVVVTEVVNVTKVVEVEVDVVIVVDVVVDVEAVVVKVIVGCSLASKTGAGEVVVVVIIGVTIEVVEDGGVGVTGSDIASCLPNMYSKTYLTTG